MNAHNYPERNSRHGHRNRHRDAHPPVRAAGSPGELGKHSAAHDQRTRRFNGRDPPRPRVNGLAGRGWPVGVHDVPCRAVAPGRRGRAVELEARRRPIVPGSLPPVPMTARPGTPQTELIPWPGFRIVAQHRPAGRVHRRLRDYPRCRESSGQRRRRGYYPGHMCGYPGLPAFATVSGMLTMWPALIASHISTHPLPSLIEGSLPSRRPGIGRMQLPPCLNDD